MHLIIFLSILNYNPQYNFVYVLFRAFLLTQNVQNISGLLTIQFASRYEKVIASRQFRPTDGRTDERRQTGQ